MGIEQRKHPRKPKVVDFYCYVEGVRFDSATLNMSEGGAFLATGDKVEVGRNVMVVPKSEQSGELPVVLAGEVMRRQRFPQPGLGIAWRRCVSKSGLHHILSFLREYLGIVPSQLPAPPKSVLEAKVAAYDFRKRRFYIPSIPMVAPYSPAQAPEAPVLNRGEPQPVSKDGSTHRKPASPVADTGPLRPMESESMLKPQPLTRDGDDGALTTMLGMHGGRIAVQVPVQFYFGEVILEGTVVAVGLTTLLLTTRHDLKDMEGRCVVAFPVPLKPEPSAAYLVCTVLGFAQTEPPGTVAIHLSITAIEQEAQPGLFERYVKFLYFRSQS